MRFVLYFFTWIFVLSTLGYLVEGDLQNFGTGLFISALMLLWSKSVRDKRRLKLGILPKVSGNKKSRFTRAFKAASEEWSLKPSSNLTANQSMSEPVSAALPVVQEPVESETNPADEGLAKETSERAMPTEAVEESLVEPETNSELAEQHPEPSTPSSKAADMLIAVDEKVVEREFWKDSKGNNLNVGSQVSFLAKSRGESVSISGVLLGERDGKALIEVQKGALLPANEYAIPWSVVSLRS